MSEKPEVEPVAFIDTFSNRLVWPGQICTNSEGRMTPLYTHPASDELRKAAERLIKHFYEAEGLGEKYIIDLQAALEKK